MKELTCIVCPRGCHLYIDDKLKVSGNFCKRGETYAIEELTHPSRILTTTMLVENRNSKLVCVKTNKKIPKEKMFDVMTKINNQTVKAPCKIGDKAIENILGLGVDIIFTSEVD